MLDFIHQFLFIESLSFCLERSEERRNEVEDVERRRREKIRGQYTTTRWTTPPGGWAVAPDISAVECFYIFSSRENSEVGISEMYNCSNKHMF